MRILEHAEARRAEACSRILTDFPEAKFYRSSKKYRASEINSFYGVLRHPLYVLTRIVVRNCLFKLNFLTKSTARKLFCQNSSYSFPPQRPGSTGKRCKSRATRYNCSILRFASCWRVNVWLGYAAHPTRLQGNCL